MLGSRQTPPWNALRCMAGHRVRRVVGRPRVTLPSEPNGDECDFVAHTVSLHWAHTLSVAAVPHITTHCAHSSCRRSASHIPPLHPPPPHSTQQHTPHVEHSCALPCQGIASNTLCVRGTLQSVPQKYLAVSSLHHTLRPKYPPATFCVEVKHGQITTVLHLCACV